MAHSRQQIARSKGRLVSPLRLGYVPLLDSAPLVVAQEEGIFERHGLSVQLIKNLGWATVRDKIIHGELDAAQAVSGMPFALTAGVGSPRRECVATLVLSLHGNAVTLSGHLNLEQPGSWQSRSGGKLVFGVVCAVSSHRFLMEEFLESRRLRSGSDYEIAVLPPPMMGTNLAAGTLDGFCVGEPWNSLAVRNGTGVIAAWSADMAPGHPEKVLMLTETFARNNRAEAVRLTRALLEACVFCQSNPQRTAALMARREYLNASPSVLTSCLTASNALGGRRGGMPRLIFHAFDSNRPDWPKADWVLGRMCRAGLIPEDFRRRERVEQNIFREDIFQEALALPEGSSTTKTKKTKQPLAPAIP